MAARELAASLRWPPRELSGVAAIEEESDGGVVTSVEMDSVEPRRSLSSTDGMAGEPTEDATDSLDARRLRFQPTASTRSVLMVTGRFSAC